MRVLALTAVVAACTTAASPAVPNATPRPPDAITQLVAAFETHPIVALDDGGHGNEAVHAFVDRLVRDPRFPATDVVVEFGTARFQALADRFVVDGVDVPRDELRQIWQQTTQILVWDAPIYEQLLRTVRDVNRTRPADRKLRVVLGDPPIDWTQVHSFKDWAVTNRDAFAAATIEREVLGRHRKALVLYGAMHVARRDIMANFEPSGMLVERLERARPHTTYAVYATPIADVHVTRPAVVDLHASELGTRDFADVLGDAAPQLRFDDTTGKPLSTDAFAKRPFRDIFDAALVITSVTYVEPPPAILADDAYYAELLRRSHILHDLALGQIEALRARAKP